MRIIGPVILAILFGLFALLIMGMGAIWVEYELPEDQPIAFPHDIHAGTGIGKLSTGETVSKLGLPCTHCHVYVDKARFATVPAMSICNSCHANLPVRTKEVEKLKKYLTNNQPVPWVRIHNLPKHVYFSHKRHIKKGIDCAKCHGDMTVVKKVKRVRTFQMGVCVSCHRANSAPRDCWTCHH